MANAALDQALADCRAALAMRPKAPDVLDSRALVYLRQGKLDRALADYDAALAAVPDMAWLHYGRSLVLRRLGRTAAADADRATALKDQGSDILRRARAAGLE